MSITKVQKRILSDLLIYKVIAQSTKDENEVYFILPDRSKSYLARCISFNQLKNAEMVEFIKEIGRYRYYKISQKGLLQITITKNKESLKPVSKYF